MTYVSDIPNETHFAIIRTRSVTIPADERSRTHPGHGYPESVETFVTYQAFTDRAAWEDEITRLMARPYEPFRALLVTPANVSTTIKVVT